MRDIEFRAKDKNTGDWVYGFYRLGSFLKDAHIDSAHSVNSWHVIPETVGQYTGLKDKNGVKIFEGDILQLGRHQTTGLVKWDKGSFLVDDEYLGWMADEFRMHGITVIGNIHDNPELAL